MAKELHEMSVAELEAAALAALTTPEEKQEEKQDEPARDEKGRFVAKQEEDAEKQEGVEEVDEVVYRRVIDLEDGSGVQVFEAPSMEELIDKLANAQVHATKKIRELSATQKVATKVVEEATGLTEDEKYILSQKILTDPASVIETFIDKALTKKIDPRLKEVEGVAREQRETKTAVDWVKNTPDYYASERNGAKMTKYLEKMGHDVTPENLQAAFEDLNASGLLEAKPTEKQDAKNDAEEAGERIAPKVETVVTKRKVVGGLSTKRQALVEVKSPEPTVADLYKMPLHELEAQTIQQMRSAN